MKGNTQNRIDKFLKDIGIYAIGNLGSKLITFMLVPLYTHYITNTDEFGYYDICLTVIFLFIPFVTLQLRDGAFRFLLDCNTKRDKAQIVSFVYRTLITSVSISAIIALIISIIRILIDFNYGIERISPLIPVLDIASAIVWVICIVVNCVLYQKKDR